MRATERSRTNGQKPEHVNGAAAPPEQLAPTIPEPPPYWLYAKWCRDYNEQQAKAAAGNHQRARAQGDPPAVQPAPPATQSTCINHNAPPNIHGALILKLLASPRPRMTQLEIIACLKLSGFEMSRDAVAPHLADLIKNGWAASAGRKQRYYATEAGKSLALALPSDDLERIAQLPKPPANKPRIPRTR